MIPSPLHVAINVFGFCLMLPVAVAGAVDHNLTTLLLASFSSACFMFSLVGQMVSFKLGDDS